MYSETQRMLAEGGLNQQGNTVDAVSGNEVPPGAMQREVRDDVDAKLSEGEFVFSADVVRYVGLQNLMKLRDKAKSGLQQMEKIGQMGNASEVDNPEALQGDESPEDFSSTIDTIMSEEEEPEQQMSNGGVIYAEKGTYVPGKGGTPSYANAPIKGFEMVAMQNTAGNIIYIPYIDGQPQLAIPAGYTVKSTAPGAETPAEEISAAANKAGTTYQEASGGGDREGGGTTAAGPVGIGAPTGLGTMDASALGKIGTAAGIASALGVPGAAFVGLGIKGLSFANDLMGEKMSKEAIARADIDSSVVGGLSATEGKAGTGAAASMAGAAAAAQADLDGLSPAAQGAAAQAAANATIAGADYADAAAIGAKAGADVDMGERSAAANLEGGEKGYGGSKGSSLGSGIEGGDKAGGANAGDGFGGGQEGAGSNFAKGGLVTKRNKKK